jgi:Ca2+/H+ antiporter, TMEM165/GDT1 family
MGIVLSLAITAVPTFLASIVEFVEALTIVLAVGTTRQWKAALWGAVGAAITLLVIIGAFGVTLATVIPQHLFQLIVGTLLLLFGLKWLRKAILRFAGIVALHDEELIYQREVAELRTQGLTRQSFDKIGFWVSYKAVLLEGLEVAFIVIAFGAQGPDELQAGIVAAALAGVVVLVAGIALKQPLTQVPENSMKFAVGVMLVTFGIYWSAEGFGVEWALSHFTPLALFAILCGLSWAAVRMLSAMLPQGAQVDARRI